MVEYSRTRYAENFGTAFFIPNNNPFDVRQNLNLPPAAREALSRGSPDPGRHPDRNSGDKYILICTVIGILIGCTIGALVGTVLGGLFGMFMGLVAGLLLGGFVGIFTGDFLKKRWLDKFNTEKEENKTEQNQGPFIN